nr:MAG TPA: hypothetical protein [Caudoviricetes sp.]
MFITLIDKNFDLGIVFCLSFYYNTSHKQLMITRLL